MKPFILFLLLATCFSCSKEEVQRNAVINAMTSGKWKMISFMDGNSNMTQDFDGYLFQFKENLTVDAIKSNAVEKTGSWNADATQKTITSQFSNATQTLMLSNGTWKITNNSWSFVEASLTENGVLRTLRLEKM